MNWTREHKCPARKLFGKVTKRMHKQKPSPLIPRNIWIAQLQEYKCRQGIPIPQQSIPELHPEHHHWLSTPVSAEVRLQWCVLERGSSLRVYDKRTYFDALARYCVWRCIRVDDRCVYAYYTDVRHDAWKVQRYIPGVCGRLSDCFMMKTSFLLILLK